MNIEEILSRYEPRMEHLLKILHQIQKEDPHNHVSEEAMKRVAGWLKRPLSSVYGVLKYYSMYSTSPRGKHVIRVCNSVVCHMHGTEEMQAHLLDALIALPEESEDVPLFTLETTECLGHCADAPVMMIDDTMYGSLTPGNIALALDTHHKKENHAQQ